MKAQTLFTISSAAIDVDLLKQNLSQPYKSTVENILSAIKLQAGQVRSINLHPYRVSRANYVKVRFHGEQGEFYLTMELSGYTEFPEITPSMSRLHININDTTDAYWLMQLMKKELCTQSVDNAV